MRARWALCVTLALATSACTSVTSTGILVNVEGAALQIDRLIAHVAIDGAGEETQEIARGSIALPTNFVASFPDRAAHVTIRIDAERAGVLVGQSAPASLELRAGNLGELTLIVVADGATPSPPQDAPDAAVPPLTDPIPEIPDGGSTTIPDASPDLQPCSGASCAALAFVDTGAPFYGYGGAMALSMSRDSNDYTRYYGRPVYYGGLVETATPNRIYELSGTEWQFTTTLLTGFFRGAAVRYVGDADEILIGGSDDPSGIATTRATAWVFGAPANPNPMSTPRMELAAVRATIGGVTRIYAIGGRNQQSPMGLASIESLDFTPSAWQPGPAMPTERYGHGAAAIDEDVYVVGGTNSDGPTRTTLRLRSGIWSARAQALFARTGVAALKAPDGRIYMIGGSDGISATATVQAYDPVGDAWSEITPLPEARMNVSAEILSDGRLFIAGGESSPGIRGNGRTWTYGPNVAVTTTPPNTFVGSPVTVTLTASNLAPSAHVSVYFDGAPVASAQTNAQGTVPTGIAFNVASCPAGHHEIVVADDQSRYPVRKNFFVCQ